MTPMGVMSQPFVSPDPAPDRLLLTARIVFVVLRALLVFAVPLDVLLARSVPLLMPVCDLING